MAWTVKYRSTELRLECGTFNVLDEAKLVITELVIDFSVLPTAPGHFRMKNIEKHTHTHSQPHSHIHIPYADG